MNRTEYALLIILLAFSIVSLGGYENGMAPERDIFAKPPVSISNLTSESTHVIRPSISTPRYQDTWFSLIKQFPAPFGHSIPLINGIIYHHAQKACWLRLADIQRQSQSILRYSQGTKLSVTITYKSASNIEQPSPQIPSSFSKNLISNSPPGIIPRL